MRLTPPLLATRRCWHIGAAAGSQQIETVLLPDMLLMGLVHTHPEQGQPLTGQNSLLRCPPSQMNGLCLLKADAEPSDSLWQASRHSIKVF